MKGFLTQSHSSHHHTVFLCSTLQMHMGVVKLQGKPSSHTPKHHFHTDMTKASGIHQHDSPASVSLTYMVKKKKSLSKTAHHSNILTKMFNKY